MLVHGLAHQGNRLLARRHQAIAPACGFHCPAFAQFDLLPQACHVFVEVGNQGVEKAEISAELLDDPLHQRMHFRQQAAFLTFTAVEHTGLGHGVEQPARGVVMLGEQRLVLQRDLEIGRVQVGESGLAAVGQIGVVEDEVEDHADQVDHVGFLLGQPVLARVVAAGFQLPVQVGLQLADGLRVAQALRQVLCGFFLQAVERIQQFVGAVGPGRGVWREAGNALAAAEIQVARSRMAILRE
ncbi:hypothetical protein D3C78_407990 [compost metagenome]